MYKRLLPASSLVMASGVVLGFWMAVSPWSHGAEDCTYSQEHEKEVLSNAATLYPGATLAAENREVSWELPDGGSTTFGYGGCYHLGSIAFQTTRSAAPLNQEQFIAVGRELAERFWNAQISGDTLALDTLSKGLDSADYTVELSRGKTFINVRSPAFAELYIEHSYENGFDRVGVAWQSTQ